MTCSDAPGPTSDFGQSVSALNATNGDYTFTLAAGGVPLYKSSTLGSDGNDTGGWRLAFDTELRSLPANAHGARYKVVAPDRSTTPYSSKGAGKPPTSDYFDRSRIESSGPDYFVVGHDGSKLKFSPVAWTAYAGENCEERRPPSGGGSSAEPRNLALEGTATSSSTNNFGVPSRAIDGNTSGIWTEGSISKTNSEDGAWLQVDLGEVKELTDVVVWNRTDSQSERFNPYYVFVSDEPFASTNRAVTAADASVAAFRRTTWPAPSTAIPVNRSGRYVRVQLDRTDYLFVAELQVFGSEVGASTPPPPPVTQVTNLAPGGTATSSSTNNFGVPARAIDGNTSGIWTEGSISKTNLEDGPWVQVDLGEVKDLTDIVVWNRTDAQAERFTPYYVFVSEVAFASTNRAVTAADPAVSAFHRTGWPAPSTTIPVNRKGRYVRVQIDRTEYMFLAELQIFGSDPVASPSGGLPPGDGDGSCVTVTAPTQWMRYLLTEVHDRYGAVTRINRDATGRATTLVSPYGAPVVTLSYDPKGAPWKVVDADSRTTTMETKLVGGVPHLWKIKEPGTAAGMLLVQEVDYDVEGRPVYFKSGAAGGVVEIVSYNPNGTIASAVSGDMAVAFTYPTPYSVVITRSMGGLAASSMTYELDPETCRVRDVYAAGGQRTQIERTPAGLIQKVTDHQTGRWMSWTYTADGLVEQWLDSDGNGATYDYHPTTRNLAAHHLYLVNGYPQHTTYSYTNAGSAMNQLTRIEGPTGSEELVLDPTTGRPLAHKVGGITVTTWTYGAGPATGTLAWSKTQEWNGSSHTTTFDGNGHVSASENHFMGLKVAYGRSAAGRPTSETHMLNGLPTRSMSIGRAAPDPSFPTSVSWWTRDGQGGTGATGATSFSLTPTSWSQSGNINGRPWSAGGAIDPTGKNIVAPTRTTVSGPGSSSSNTMASPGSVQYQWGLGY